MGFSGLLPREVWSSRLIDKKLDLSGDDETFNIGSDSYFSLHACMNWMFLFRFMITRNIWIWFSRNLSRRIVMGEILIFSLLCLKASCEDFENLVTIFVLGIFRIAIKSLLAYISDTNNLNYFPSNETVTLHLLIPYKFNEIFSHVTPTKFYVHEFHEFRVFTNINFVARLTRSQNIYF